MLGGRAMRLPNRNSRYNLTVNFELTERSGYSPCSRQLGYADKDGDTVYPHSVEGGPRMAIRCTIICLTVAATLLAGCRTARQVRDPEYAQVSQAVCQSWCAPSSTVVTTAPVFAELEGPHPVEHYIQLALEQNPDVQAARKRLEAAALEVPQAASLKDPMLDATGWPFYPNVPQTASGRMTVDLMVSQEVPWYGKLGAKAAAAEAEANSARARLATVELETIESVKKAYYELYFIQQATMVTQEERDLLIQIRDTANARYRAALTSQQDLLRAELELSNIEENLIRLRQQLDSGQARLARQLHVAPQTKLRALDRLTPEDVPRDLDALQRRAVADRPELHAQLAMLERDRQMAEVAQLEYLPNFTFRAGWGEMTTDKALAPTADGIDNVTVGMGVNVPMYRKRLNAGVRQAEANAVATAREYDSLRDATLEQVLDLFAQAQSQQELLTLFEEDILPKARQTLEVSTPAYNVGQIDFLTLLDNFRQLLRYEVSYRRLEASLHQTLAELERVVGGSTAQPSEAIPVPEGPTPSAAAPLLLPATE
jgi:outer membrane protein TolC